MTSFHENLKTIIGETEKFLTETLKKEKLSSASKDHKQLILDKISQLREEYPQFSPTKASEDVGKSKQDLDKLDDESTRTGGSSNADSAEDPYNDQGIPDIPASDAVKGAARSGYLEKKQPKKGLLTGKLQKRFCVIKGEIFYYYEKEKDKKQKGSFRLAGYEFRACPDLVKDTSKKDLCFELYTGEKRTYQFVAPSKEDFDGWRNAVLSATSSGSFDDNYDEDIYEPIGDEQDNPPPPPDDTDDDFYSAPTEEEVSEKSPVKVIEPVPELEQDDIYEDTAQEPAEPPKSPKLPQPDDLEQDDEYTDTAAPPIPGRPLPRPPPPTPDSKAPELPGRSRKPNLPPPPIPTDDGPISSEPLPPPPPTMELPPVPTDEEKTPKPSPKKRKVLPRDQDFENLYYGLWDCTADRDNELSFKKGDMILIINRDFDDRSWWIGELGGKFGLVPKNYLTNAYTPATA